MSISKKVNKKNSLFAKKDREYRYVNANPLIKSVTQTLIMLIDIMVLIVLIWNLFSYLIPFGSLINVVSGDSMYPTMHDGQVIFTDTSAIDRGDIITAYFPQQVVNEKPAKEGTVMVKRVIGVPGDKIKISDNGSVYINDNLLKEDYLSNDAISYTYIENGYNSVLLKDDEYFVMGDNRDVSYDSRYFGAIKSSDLIYAQSTTPTSNFYFKAALIVVVFIFDIFLYTLIEFVLMECVEYLLSKCHWCAPRSCDIDNTGASIVEQSHENNLETTDQKQLK